MGIDEIALIYYNNVGSPPGWGVSVLFLPHLTFGLTNY
jgi:hypothetical protein